MYTRSYYPDSGNTVPENYGGVALSEPLSSVDTTQNLLKDEQKEAESVNCLGGVSGISSIPWLSKIFTGVGRITEPIGIKSFGTEELLIVGVALYLLFSKSGDKECAITLLLLLLVN